MHVSDVKRVKRELGQLVKAEMDMRLVAEAATALAEDQYPTCPRILETGLIVAYCRAFTKDGRGRIPVTTTMVPTAGEDLRLHNVLFKLRDTVYAHSDETMARGAFDPFGEHAYVEGYRPLRSEVLPQIGELAGKQQRQFRAAIEDRSRRLTAAGVPPDPSL